jgi:hypothetical protein
MHYPQFSFLEFAKCELFYLPTVTFNSESFFKLIR